jgi:acetyl esterase/lipase
MGERWSARRLVLAGLLGLALGAVPGAAWAAGPARPGGVREALDVRYAPGAGGRHTLDVFSPAGGGGKRPVVLFIHGGTWMYGDKDFFGLYRGVGRYLARHGVVAVLANYRLTPRVRHPEHVRDVARAFAWTYKNVARFGGDPHSIFLCGHSAGGHLIALLATDEEYLRDPGLGLAPGAREAIRGVIGVCGVYRIPSGNELATMMKQIVSIWVGPEERVGLGRVLRPALLMVGEEVNPFRLAFGSDPKARERASPLAHVRKGLPPFLLLYAWKEVPGLAGQAEDFATALRKAGNEVECREMAGTGHRTILFHLGGRDDRVGKTILGFIHKHAPRRADVP